MHPVLGLLVVGLLILFVIGGLWLSSKPKQYAHGGMVPNKTWSYPVNAPDLVYRVIDFAFDPSKEGHVVGIVLVMSTGSTLFNKLDKPITDRGDIHLHVYSTPLSIISVTPEGQMVSVYSHEGLLNPDRGVLVFGSHGTVAKPDDKAIGSISTWENEPVGHMHNAQTKYDGTTKS